MIFASSTRTLYCGRCEKSSVEFVTPSAEASAFGLGAGLAACNSLVGREDATWMLASLSARRPLTLLETPTSASLPLLPT